ncbi:DUF2073 domain-containing protein [Candidatus Woesearchaeota archaeon]|nr:DUF2073 domain-containing protein [Candidatus Woesearchaeota archaeon]
MGNLTLQFVPYQDISGMSSLGRIKKLLKLAREDKIVLLEGRLKKEEETELIKTTMEQIDNEFRGIELAVIYPGSRRADDALQWIKNNVISMVLGDRVGFTVIGPASVVKEIRQAPEKIQVYTREVISKKGAKKKKRGR